MFDLRVGDALTTRGVPLRVIGLFRDEVAPRTADVALCAPGDARALLGLEVGEATDIAVELRSPAARREVLRASDVLLPDARALAREDLRLRPVQAAISEAEIDAALARRNAARAAKDFAASDAIRDELATQGVEVMDGDPLAWEWKL